MGRKLGLWLVWLGFVLYVLILAPLPPDSWQPLQTLLSGRFQILHPTMLPVVNSQAGMAGSGIR